MGAGMGGMWRVHPRAGRGWGEVLACGREAARRRGGAALTSALQMHARGDVLAGVGEARREDTQQLKVQAALLAVQRAFAQAEQQALAGLVELGRRAGEALVEGLAA